MSDEKTDAGSLAREMRRSENRTLLLVAVIGVASALLGSSVGGYFSSKATTDQLDAASRQVIYADKKSAYIDYSRVDAALKDLEFSFGYSFSSLGNSPENEIFLKAQREKYDAAVASLHQEQDNMYLVETDVIRSKRIESEDLQYVIQKEIYDAFDGLVEGRTAVGDSISAKMNERYEKSTALKDLLRDDLAKGGG